MQILSITLFCDITVLVSSSSCVQPIQYKLYSNLLKRQTVACPDYKDKIAAFLKVVWKSWLHYLKTKLQKKSEMIHVGRYFNLLFVMDVMQGLHSDAPEQGCDESLNSANTLHLGRDILRISISKVGPLFAVMSVFSPICERPALCWLISWIHHG